MSNSGDVREQIASKIKDSSNILVTVNKNPSVDELTAALGFTLMLNKLNKHATAVVSGKIPPAIEFLQPGKTFEHTVDSLRDFIIALDKDKADHLRYKADGDVVKIFITPYRTTITEEDLEFTLGDYNVELVIAIGVKNQSDLDDALSAHGKILHDATVITLDAEKASELGSINWHGTGYGGVSEMVASLSDDIKKDKPLLDKGVSTALLTGIVAKTERFSNDFTTSDVMTIAAKLMAGGANQQLIASKLAESSGLDDATQDKNRDGTTDMKEDKLAKNSAPKGQEGPAKEEDKTTLKIAHEKAGDLDSVKDQVVADNQENAINEVEQKLKDASTQQPEAEDINSGAAVTTDISSPNSSVGAPEGEPNMIEAAPDPNLPQDNLTEAPPIAPMMNTQESIIQQNEVREEKKLEGNPTLGGTLNASSAQAAEDARRQAENDQNKMILSHTNAYLGDSAPLINQPAINSSSEEVPQEQVPLQDISSQQAVIPPLPEQSVDASVVAPEVPVPEAVPQAAIREDVLKAFGEASGNSDNATIAQPQPAPPAEIDLGQALTQLDQLQQGQEVSPLPQQPAPFGTLPDSLPADPIGTTPDLMGLPPMPPVPPMPDLLPPPLPPLSPPVNPTLENPVLPAENLPIGTNPEGSMPGLAVPEMATAVAEPTPQASNDPGQFKIPGQ